MANPEFLIMAVRRQIEVVQSQEHPGLYKVQFQGGGEPPPEWKGQLFTSHTAAEKHIQEYLARRK